MRRVLVSLMLNLFVVTPSVAQRSSTNDGLWLSAGLGGGCGMPAVIWPVPSVGSDGGNAPK